MNNLGFPGGSDGKESAWNVGNPGSIPESKRSPGEGNGNPLKYSCLENSMDRGTWRTTVHGGHKELDTTERLTPFILTMNNLVTNSKHEFTRHLSTTPKMILLRK